jgi:hypothetical protein
MCVNSSRFVLPQQAFSNLAAFINGNPVNVVNK